MVYARDLKKELLTDECFGKGFEKKLAEANKKGYDLTVGKYYHVKDMEYVY